LQLDWSCPPQQPTATRRRAFGCGDALGARSFFDEF
jgi:hypothetical protein